MISGPRLSVIWSVGLGLFGTGYWLYGFGAVLAPTIFAPWGYTLGIYSGVLVLFLAVTGWLAGRENMAIAWDESMQYDSNRAYRFGFNVACLVYIVFWVLLVWEWVPVEAAFPAMGAFTGGSYCLFLGVTGLRGWYETRHALD